MHKNLRFTIEYKVEDHGWATIILSDREVIYDSAVSYLHDSLDELAQMAIDLRNGATESKAVFMDEPGELHFLVTVENDIASYEARLFSDWVSWNMHPELDYDLVLSGKCKPQRIINQITKVLWGIHEQMGPDLYKERWVKHEFPMEKYRILANA